MNALIDVLKLAELALNTAPCFTVARDPRLLSYEVASSISLVLRQKWHVVRLFEYDELSDVAKENARTWYSRVCAEDDWFDATKEDAERAGITIKEFDLDRNEIEIEFDSGLTVAEHIYIFAEHGKECDTYKAAEAFEAANNAMPDIDQDNMAEQTRLCEASDANESAFKRALEKAYLKMLQAEYDYRHTDEYIEDGIRANEYTFDANGKRCG